MVLSKELKEDIKQQLIKKIMKKIESYDFSKTSGNPFIDLIFGKYSNLKSFIHGMATTLGSDYEIIARKIGQANPRFVEAKKIAFIGKISNGESAAIKHIAKDLEEKETDANYDREIGEIYKAVQKDMRDNKITIDLFLKDKNGKEYYIEMKGPDPNKKEVRAAKEDLLNVVAMKKREVKLEDFNKKVSIIFGVYYNNNEGEYKNWKVSPMFEKNNGLLVQEEFWDFIGGSGTFEELLKVIEEVRDEVKPIIKKAIDGI